MIAANSSVSKLQLQNSVYDGAGDSTSDGMTNVSQSITKTRMPQEKQKEEETHRSAFFFLG